MSSDVASLKMREDRNFSPMLKRRASRRIIIDLTDLIGHLARDGGVSGIPRVVFEFVNAVSKLDRDDDVDLMLGFYDPFKEKYFQLETPSLREQPDVVLHWLLSDRIFRHGYPRPIDFPRLKFKYADRPIRYYWHTNSARVRLLRRRVQHQMLNLIQGRKLNEIHFQGGDDLLLLGSSWTEMPFIDFIEPLQRGRLISATVLIHDLIPLTNVPKDVPAKIFQSWLDRLSYMGCRFLTVSAATRTDLENYLTEHQIDFSPIAVVPLAHEFTARTSPDQAEKIQNLIADKYALFVGPVSGRKNAKRVLEAWAKVLDRVGKERMPKLVITSRRGADDIYKSHIAPIEGHVQLLDGPGDYELSQLYAHADFTIFPSLYEGWGLPVGESLWHGTPCITSNTTSLPEVGGDLCDYVDPTSVESITAVVERFVSDQQYRRGRAEEIRGRRLRRWSDFANQVLNVTVSTPLNVSDGSADSCAVGSELIPSL